MRVRLASLAALTAALLILVGARMAGASGSGEPEPVKIIVSAEPTESTEHTLSAQNVKMDAPPPEEEEAPESHYIIYDVPLSEELQHYTQDVCEEYGVSYPLVLAVIEKESMFDTDAVSQTHDYGLMQINQMNHEWLAGVLGITDWLDPKQNILAGVYVLSQYDYEHPHQVLMSYNCGPTGAKNLWADGVYSTAYSQAVVEILDGLEVMTNE